MVLFPAQARECSLLRSEKTKRHPVLIQWAPGDFSPGVQRPEREADHSRPSSAQL